MSHSSDFFNAVRVVGEQIVFDKIEAMVDRLLPLRSSAGRLFLLGVGGSAANCSHAVNDFRKICGIEAYAPTDNVAELTARTNDNGWDTVFVDWLKISKLGPSDILFVMSVNGGTPGTSKNLLEAIDYAKNCGSFVMGVTGRHSGALGMLGDLVLVIPKYSDTLLTPLAESFQAIVWHCIVSHPLMRTS